MYCNCFCRCYFIAFYRCYFEETNYNFFQVTQNCSTLLTVCKWKGIIDQCDRYFKQSLSRDGLCCSFNYYTFPDTITSDKYKYYFCGEVLSFTKDFKVYMKSKKEIFLFINENRDYKTKKLPFGTLSCFSLPVVCHFRCIHEIAVRVL